MGVSSPTLLTISSIVLVFITFGIHNSVEIESCSEHIRQVCDCFYYPLYTVRCTHKNLLEYPNDFLYFQVILCFFGVFIFIRVVMKYPITIPVFVNEVKVKIMVKVKANKRRKGKISRMRIRFFVT